MRNASERSGVETAAELHYLRRRLPFVSQICRTHTATMNPEAQTLRIVLQKEVPGQSWGFRMQGGSDFTTPLSVQMVSKKLAMRDLSPSVDSCHTRLAYRCVCLGELAARSAKWDFQQQRNCPLVFNNFVFWLDLFVYNQRYTSHKFSCVAPFQVRSANYIAD